MTFSYFVFVSMEIVNAGRFSEAEAPLTNLMIFLPPLIFDSNFEYFANE